MDRKPAILIVHGQQFLIDLLRDHLIKDGFQVVGAASGDEARQAFESNRPDLVVISSSVPGGMNFIGHLRSADAPCDVIGITDSPEARQSMEGLGVEVILGSDATLQALLAAIRAGVAAAAGIETDSAARILVVDDEEDLLQVIKLFLNARGYSVTTATNGSDALQVLKRDPAVRLVLLDIKIPEIGGLEVLRQIMGRTPHPEVIMMTGVQDADIARLAFKLGAFDYFTKPFEWTRLEGLISACLAHMDFQRDSHRPK